MPLRLGAGCQGNQPGIGGLELSVPPPGLWGKEKGWRWKQSPVAIDLINQACVMKPP